MIDVTPIESLFSNINLDKDGTEDELTLVKKRPNDSEFLYLDAKIDKTGIGEVKTLDSNKLWKNRYLWSWNQGLRGHQVGTTHLGVPGEGRPGGLCPPRCHPPMVLGSRNSCLLYKNSSQNSIPFRELVLHKNNTMIVLLKTASVRG